MHKIYSNLMGFQMLRFIIHGEEKENCDPMIVFVSGNGWGCSYPGGTNGDGESMGEWFDYTVRSSLTENA